MFTQMPHRHTPSSERGEVHIWLDFLLHGSQLYDKKTGLSKCSLCGAEIRVPTEYGKIMPIWAYGYSLGSYAVFLLILQQLHDNTTWGNGSMILLALLCGICMFAFVKRINKARLLTQYQWVEISCDSPDELFEKEIRDDNKRIRYAESSGLFAAIIIIRLFR